MRRFVPPFAALLLFGCMLALVALRLSPAPPGNAIAETARRLTTPPTADPAGQRERRTSVVTLVERISPAVVNISAESIVREADPFFGGFFGTRQRRPQSLGSGFIVDTSGVVVTNAHVVQGASSITVTTLNGRELKAQVLGSDRDA